MIFGFDRSASSLNEYVFCLTEGHPCPGRSWFGGLIVVLFLRSILKYEICGLAVLFFDSDAFSKNECLGFDRGASVPLSRKVDVRQAGKGNSTEIVSMI
jgi:hypothetical protein